MRALAPRRFVVLLVVLLLAPPSGLAQATSTPEERAAAIVQPAIVYIETDWSAWVKDHDDDWLNDGYAFEWTTACSGFVVNPLGYIVTAGHCVDDSLDFGARADAIEFGIQDWIDHGWAAPSDVDQLRETAYANWQIEGRGAGDPPDRTVRVTHALIGSDTPTEADWPARVVDVRSLNEGDVALLKVEEDGLPTVQLAGSESIAIGTPVLSVGYPAASAAVTDPTLTPSFKDGSISSRGTRENGLLPVYEMSAALTKGMSGGPTVNNDGDVIGVNSFSVAGETQQFNFLSPASLVSEMLSRNGVSNEPGPLDALYRAALDDYFEGDYVAAMAGLGQVLDRLPSHSLAQEYRSKAAERAAEAPPVTPAPATATPTATAAPTASPEPAAEEGLFMLGAGIIGGLALGGLLLAVVVGAWVVRRRGRGPQRTPGAAEQAVDHAQPPAEAAWAPPGWHLPSPPEPSPARQPSAIQATAHDVFVSYSTPDKAIADAIVSRLEQDGIRCWVAPRDVMPGKVWSEAIVDAIGTSRLMVVVLSGDANQSQQVIREVERAVANDVIVVPFRIESIEPTGAMAYFLASEHWLDAMTPPIESHIAQLVRVANALLERQSAEQVTQAPTGAQS